MIKYKSIKCDNQKQFDYLQNHFLNKGYMWCGGDDDNYHIMEYDMPSHRAFLIDYENKKIGVCHITSEYIAENFIVEKAIDYNFFMRTFKINKIND